MKQMNVYLTFAGNCEAALNFYADALNGTIEFKQRFGEGPMEIPEDQKDLILHARMNFNGIVLMASDLRPDDPLILGNQVALSLDFESEAEQTAVFDKLAVGANVTMQLEDTFWGARFGMLTDQFGVNWMFNYDKTPGAE